MTLRRYRNCQRPALGLLLWATGHCVFPPLFEQVAIDLSRPGAEVSQTIRVEVPLDYALHLHTRFPSDAARIADKVIGQYVGGHCGTGPREPAPASVRERIGTPIRFQVRVESLANQDLVIDTTVESRCSFGHRGASKWREIAVLPLAAGEYRVTVGAPDGEPALAGTRSYLELQAPRGK